MNIIANLKNSAGKKSFLVLLAIIILAASLRLYNFTVFPPSLSWDEAAVGYNAYSIIKTGHDEWGEFMPLVFKSFRDDKHPVHIYTTSLFIAVFGANELGVRLPSAVFGILNVILLFWLAKLIFKSNLAGLFASFSLAISPWGIHFSRFNHELNFALFFFMLGFCLFLQGLQRKNIYLTLAFLAWGISLIAYHSSKVVVPPIIGLAVAFYIPQLLKIKKYFFSGVVILLLFIGLIISNPGLLGIARVQQTSFSEEQIKNTSAYKRTNLVLVGRMEITYQQYLDHFSLDYLFKKGDLNPRLGTHHFGQFYYFDLLFFVLGLIYLIKYRTRPGLILLVWAILGPLPSALAAESPQSGRAMYMVGSFHLIMTAGLILLINLFKNIKLRSVVVFLVVIIYLGLLVTYLDYYYKNYSDLAIEWQYGTKQVVEFVKNNPQYHDIYMTKERSQPYIFFLFNLKYPLADYLYDVELNKNESRTHNLVSRFGKYNFEWFDPTKMSFPDSGKLYILTSSQYDGLVARDRFIIKETILHPNKTVAFFIVSIN